MSPRKCVIFTAAAMAILAFVNFTDAVPMVKRAFSGDGTFYNCGLSACGGTYHDSDYIAALNKPQWGNPINPNNNPICGSVARVTGPKGSVTVTIVDLCPECLFGSLDLSPAAFNQIADQSAGRVPISWEFTSGGAHLLPHLLPHLVPHLLPQLPHPRQVPFLNPKATLPNGVNPLTHTSDFLNVNPTEATKTPSPGNKKKTH
ncbi:1255_t:CDS:2 [Ambispora gerdemannii]|uniref:1255_t:CDS:1 n=1 Tax=Ambispora gerdemannii TaxID=144530 RepID=A0A9N8WJJ0_9GLOM|nr:1255_t:CDS:2 [Ambispora gerdemannii]